MSTAVTITPDSAAAMMRAMRDVQKYLKKSEPETLKFCADMFCRSAAARCKPGQKRRQVFPPAVAGQPWLIQVYSQRGVTMVPSTEGRKDKRVKIERRGLLRQSWWWLQKLVRGKREVSRIPGVPVGSAVAEDQKLSGDAQFIELANKLSYVAKAAPGVSDAAMATAARGVQHRIDRVVGKQAERLWR